MTKARRVDRERKAKEQCKELAAIRVQ